MIVALLNFSGPMIRHKHSTMTQMRHVALQSINQSFIRLSINVLHQHEMIVLVAFGLDVSLG